MSTSRRAVFLDRDDTLIHDVPYNGDASKVALMPEAPEALLLLRLAGFRLFVLSNQSGVGRGKVTLEQVAAVNDEMVRQFGPTLDGDPWFDEILVCPHAPEDDCACRKPKPQLALDAAERHGLDLAASFVVGDKSSDTECARAAGMRGIRYRPTTAAADPTKTQATAEADFATSSLIAAAKWIIGASH